MRRQQSLVLLFLLLLCACRSTTKPTISNPENFTEQALMSIHMQQPEQALNMVDTAVLVGTITNERAEYLRACIYYTGLNDVITAKHIALQLAEETTNDSLLIDTYSLLANMAHSDGDDNGVMRYAPIAYEIATENGWYAEIGQMSAYIALAMAHQGQTDEAMKQMQDAVNGLEKEHSWYSMVAYMSAVKSMLQLMYETDHTADMPQAAEHALQHLEYFEKNQALFSNIPQGFSPDEFIDMSRAQLFSILSIAQATCGNKTGARHSVRQALATDYGQSGRADKILITTWLELGDWQSFDKAIEERELCCMGDSINRNHYVTLQNRSKAAERRGRMAEALHFERRAAVIQDSLTTKHIQQQIAEQATLYNLHEATLAQERAEAHSRTIAMILIIAIIVIIFTTWLSLYFFITRRETRLKNKALIRLIDEQVNHDNTAINKAENTEPTNDDAEDILYSRLQALVAEQNLYSDITLDRDRVAELLGIRRQALNQLLNKYAAGKSFPQWLNQIRITEASRLLHDNADMTINDIASAVGLTPQNLRLLFKQHYGLTPSEYRNSEYRNSEYRNIEYRNIE